VPVRSMKRLVAIEGCTLFSPTLEAFRVSSFRRDKFAPAVDGQYNQPFHSQANLESKASILLRVLPQLEKKSFLVRANISQSVCMSCIVPEVALAFLGPLHPHHHQQIEPYALPSCCLAMSMHQSTVVGFHFSIW
jgi:hypothetical protein